MGKKKNEILGFLVKQKIKHKKLQNYWINWIKHKLVPMPNHQPIPDYLLKSVA